MARILVTGGGGFIGRNTIPSLLAQGHSLVALQRQSSIVPTSHPLLSIVHGDLREDIASLAEAASDCDTMLHLAGDTTPSSSADRVALEFQANLLPLLQLLDALRHTAIKRVVLLSSGGTVYGRPHVVPIDENHPTTPTSHYGFGKLAAEHLTRLWATQHNREYILLRAANPYGPHQLGRNDQGVIGVWLQNAISGRPLIVWGGGTSIRDYLYIGDLVEALTLACTYSNLEKGIYNIGSGGGNSLLQIAEAISMATGIQPRLEFIPPKPYDVAVNVLCPKRFHAATGWRARTDLLTGIRLTHAFLQQR